MKSLCFLRKSIIIRGIDMICKSLVLNHDKYDCRKDHFFIQVMSRRFWGDTAPQRYLFPPS